MSDGLNAAPRFEDPSRPSKVSNLPPVNEVRRPWLVPVSVLLVVLATAALGAMFALIAIDQEAFRQTLQTQLARRQPDYALGDVRKAVAVGLLILGVLSVLFMVGELRATVRLLDKRKSARTALLIYAALHLTIVGAVAQAYEGGQEVRLAAAAGASALVLGAVAACLWPVGRWLKATQRQGPIPLRTSSHRQD